MSANWVKYAGISALLVLTATGWAQPPSTKKVPVTDTYHGVTVTENYRWLENFDDPEVKEWMARQNEFTHSQLDQVPARPAIVSELERLWSKKSSSYYSLVHRPGLLFAMKNEPPAQQPFIVTLTDPNELSSERVVVDPNRLDTTGETSIDWYVPSRDGRLVAVSLSYRGSEDGTLYLFEVATGHRLPDSIPRVQFPTAGGSVAWNADGSGFWYTRFPEPGERPEQDIHFYQQVYYHRVGAPVSEDRYEIGKDFPRIAEIELEASTDGQYVLAVVQNGDGGEFEHYLRRTDGQWTRLTDLEDRITRATFGRDDAIYMLSLKDTPKGRLLRMSLHQTELDKTKPVIEEGEFVLSGFCPTASRLYVVEQAGGPSQIRAYDLEGNEQQPVPVAPVSSVGTPVWLDGDRVLYPEQSYLMPSTWKQYDPATGRATPTAMKKSSVANFEDAEVIREFAVSRDGTRVPINILRKKRTKLDGSNPTILYGYGGYGINQTPYFSERNRLWLDMGGVYVTANLRGGGEFGEEWHRQGNLTNKQNVFDDFAACAQWLIENNYTNPQRLAIEGGSNGGLLVNATLTQHPEMFAAVVSKVSIADMLRVELHPNGEFNTTEFGTVKNPDHFKALYGYSPYHRVQDGVAYPAVLLTAGDHDGRVDPYHTRKMAARLQAATSSSRPILLRTSSATGHGIGSSLNQRISLEADVLAFLVRELEIEYPDK